MKRWVVDTNVPIVANGRTDGSRGARPPVRSCRLAAVNFLDALLRQGTVLLDAAGEIQEEYRRHLSPSGQPGVGDRFYQAVIHSGRVERIQLPKGQDGTYADFPADPALATFDDSDRKFVALGLQANAPVAVATDSDWVQAKTALNAHGLKIHFLCGEDPAQWFDPVAVGAPEQARQPRRSGGSGA